MSSGKTITTYLVDGHPKGVRTCFISNKVCKAVVVPRAKILEVKNRDELEQPALYVLLSEQDNKIYIGETENFLFRIQNHNAKKSFWDEAIVFVSKDNDLTKSDIKYLEYLAIRRAKETQRFNLDENKISPGPTNMPEHQQASVEEFFEDVQILTAFLGIPVFEKVKRHNRPLFYCKGRQAKASGFYDENGFTVLAGSVVPVNSAPSLQGKERRDEMIRSMTLNVSESTYTLERDITFSSPSAASSFCIGRTSNGWVDWVDPNGKTLDEVYRSKSEDLEAAS